MGRCCIPNCVLVAVSFGRSTPTPGKAEARLAPGLQLALARCKLPLPDPPPGLALALLMELLLGGLLDRTACEDTSRLAGCELATDIQALPGVTGPASVPRGEPCIGEAATCTCMVCKSIEGTMEGALGTLGVPLLLRSRTTGLAGLPNLPYWVGGGWLAATGGFTTALPPAGGGTIELHCDFKAGVGGVPGLDGVPAAPMGGCMSGPRGVAMGVGGAECKTRGVIGGDLSDAAAGVLPVAIDIGNLNSSPGSLYLQEESAFGEGPDPTHRVPYLQ
mmetsp:Transcript_25485/g.59357  ORF Transcript_25485/g.59357 Transcript_25485/m.59357 type:complete len:276 (+) Transcript_25485:1725-2552(+)